MGALFSNENKVAGSSNYQKGFAAHDIDSSNAAAEEKIYSALHSREIDRDKPSDTIELRNSGYALDDETELLLNSITKGEINRDTGYLQFERNPQLRMIFLTLAKMLYFVVGAGYYTFPVWLNQIISEHVTLSRSFLSILGGSIYISLGLFGGILVLIKRLGMSRHTEFRVVTTIASLFTIIPWLILYQFGCGHVTGTVGYNLYILEICLVAMALADGVFYMVWFNEVLILIRSRWHFLVIAFCSVAFAGGALAAYCLKLFVGNDLWIQIVAFTTIGYIITVVSFTFYYQYDIFYMETPVTGTNTDTNNVDKTKQETTATVSVSTTTMLYDLFAFNRIMSVHELQNDEWCDVSSAQFYLLILLHTVLYAMGTTFMANVGIIIASDGSSSEGTDDLSDHDQLIILIYATIGQIIGRIVVPIISYIVDLYVPKYDEGTVSAYNHDEKRKKYELHVRQLRVTNRSVLFVSLVIGILFMCSLLIFRYTDNKLSFTDVSVFVVMCINVYIDMYYILCN